MCFDWECIQYLFVRAVTGDMNLGTSDVRKQLKDQFQIDIDNTLLRNLIAEARGKLGYGSPNEAQKIVEYLGTRGAVRPFLDNEGRMSRLVFVSSWAKKIWKSNVCHQVLQIDAAHKTNRWGFYFIPITGVGPTGHNVSLGCFALKSEGEEDYVWALNQVKAIVGTCSPVKVVFTDGLPVYKRVVERCFPGAAHLRCWFHIQKYLKAFLGVTTRLGGVFSKLFWPYMQEMASAYSEEVFLEMRANLLDQLIPSWCAAMNAVNRTKSIVEFLSNGDNISDEHSRDGVFAIARQWAFCYTKQYFTRGMRSTQRGESSNYVIKRGVASRAYLLEPFRAVIGMEKRQAQELVVTYNKFVARSASTARLWNAGLRLR